MVIAEECGESIKIKERKRIFEFKRVFGEFQTEIDWTNGFHPPREVKLSLVAEFGDFSMPADLIRISTCLTSISIHREL